MADKVGGAAEYPRTEFPDRQVSRRLIHAVCSRDKYDPYRYGYGALISRVMLFEPQTGAHSRCLLRLIRYGFFMDVVRYGLDATVDYGSGVYRNADTFSIVFNYHSTASYFVKLPVVTKYGLKMQR